MVTGFRDGSLTRITEPEEEERLSTCIAITVQANAPDLMSQLSQRLNAQLLRSLEGSGFKQPNEVIEQERAPWLDEWRFIAPGVMVRPAEFHSRYGTLDLLTMRARMKPEIFQAFVRSIGSIQSLPDTDVNDLIRQENL